MTSAEIDLQPLQAWLGQLPSRDRSRLLPTLIEAQRQYGCLEPAVLTTISQALRVSEAEIHGVVSFYTLLYDRPTGRTVIRVCTSPVCAQAGGETVLRELCQHLKVHPGEPTADGAFEIEEVPCLCLCDHAPAALHGDLPVGNLHGVPVAKWLGNPQEIGLGEIRGAPRRLTARCGTIDPTDVQAYAASGGYAGLKRALSSLTPQQVIDEIEASGLDGRGGAAFPTGRKWALAASGEAPQRYVVCNGDESEPGTFKDRVLLEGDPLAVLEGMALAGYAIGASQGYLYVRGEYPRAQRILRQAIQAARDAGTLGARVLGSEFSFDVELRSGRRRIHLRRGDGAVRIDRGQARLPTYQTTLPGNPWPVREADGDQQCRDAVHGRLDPGTRRRRPPFRGGSGFAGHQAVLPVGRYRPAGHLRGALRDNLGELLDLAGGVRGELQAILLGGAAGAFAGPEALDLSLTHAACARPGCRSARVVMHDHERQPRSAADVLCGLARFFAHELCGKCFPCQLGTQRQHEIVDRLAHGRLHPGDLEALDDVAFAMTETSICGLGVTASTAILSARRRWPAAFQPEAG